MPIFPSASACLRRLAGVPSGWTVPLVSSLSGARWLSHWRVPLFAGVLVGCWGTAAWAGHGYALWGEPKLPAQFAHFAYVNPAAPKGGELRMVSNLRTSTFDKYNPFTTKGSAPAYLSAMLFESLLVSALDEPGAAYGLLAEDVQVPADRLSATFRLRSAARFHNGDPVQAADVVHALNTLKGPHVSPAYGTALQDVVKAEALDARTVRFHFKAPNRELPLLVGGLPIFSRKWGEGKAFDQVVMETPIGSGAYQIGPVVFGRDITYVRDPNHWARELNVRVGTANFDRVTVKIYKDNTARLEALKAGEFDVMNVYSAGDWARRMTGGKFKTGELVKGEFPSGNPSGFQSYVLNTRRPALTDVRVREALGLAIDYEWMNRQLFFNAYQRVQGLFGNTACHATGSPDAAQLALMNPWRAQLPAAAFGPAYLPPRTDSHANGLRENLRKAKALLAEAGWQVKDGALRDAQGKPMVLEYLDSNEAGARTVTPWMRNLEKLGIQLQFRVADFALYQRRLQQFDFDITTLAFRGSNNPGQEFVDMFGSESADVPDSGNYTGIKSPAIDALIGAMVKAQTHPDYLAACRALERAITHSHLLLPQWHSGVARLAYNQKRLAVPSQRPPNFMSRDGGYDFGEGWVLDAWWAKSAEKP